MNKRSIKQLFLRVCCYDLTVFQRLRISKEFDKNLYDFIKRTIDKIPNKTIAVLIEREIPVLKRVDVYDFLNKIYRLSKSEQNKLRKSVIEKVTVQKEGNEELYLMYYGILVDDKLDKKEFDKELEEYVKEINRLDKALKQRKKKGK